MDYIGARYPRPLPSFLKSDQEYYKILIVQKSIVLPNSPFPKEGYRGITGIPKCRGIWPYALSPPRLGKPEELEKRCPSQKDQGFGGVPQSLNVIASGAKQSHRIPLYLQARGDCLVVLLYGRTPRNDIHITPRLGEPEELQKRCRIPPARGLGVSPNSSFSPPKLGDTGTCRGALHAPFSFSDKFPSGYS